MRRERRGFGKEHVDMKRVLYIAGGILSLSVIAFIAVFILYGGSNNNDETQIARYNVEDYVSNSTEEASSQMGRTVNEVQESETNEIASNTVDTEKATEDDTKYAVNTSKSETNTVESNTTKSNDESKATEKNADQKEEKVADPEFAMPVEGDIIREYAKDNLVYSSTLDEWITHNGIDIAAEKTTVVKASEAGTIKSIKNDPRYGLTVVIEHVNGFSSVYSNLLTAEFVEEGEKVEKGQTIGTVGNTATFEIADESHLHFEILKDDEYVDPELYIK